MMTNYSIRHFCFWQNILSPHQSDFLSSLRNAFPCNIYLMVQEMRLPERREQMGWSMPVIKGIDIVDANSSDATDRLVSLPSFASCHIFSGPWGYPVIRRRFYEALNLGLFTGIMSEPGDWRGLSGKLRILRSTVYRLLFEKQISFVLATGKPGKDWFRTCGFPERKILDWGYFLNPIPNIARPHSQRPSPDEVQIVSIASQLYDKGFDILFFALSRLQHLSWHLTLIGDGPQREINAALAQKLGIFSRVTFCGVLTNNSAREFLLLSDLFVLPTRYDGWGVVVNEALLAGVPVICSNACGALSLIENSNRGSVFASESISALCQSLEHWILQGPLPAKKRKDLINWSKAIQGPAIAKYFIQAINEMHENGYSTAVPPWKS